MTNENKTTRMLRKAVSKGRSNGGYVASPLAKNGIMSADNIYNNKCIYPHGRPKDKK